MNKETSLSLIIKVKGDGTCPLYHDSWLSVPFRSIINVSVICKRVGTKDCRLVKDQPRIATMTGDN